MENNELGVVLHLFEVEDKDDDNARVAMFPDGDFFRLKGDLNSFFMHLSIYFPDADSYVIRPISKYNKECANNE